MLSFYIYKKIMGLVPKKKSSHMLYFFFAVVNISNVKFSILIEVYISGEKCIHNVV